jgi:methylmalonyl-CoA mutase
MTDKANLFAAFSAVAKSEWLAAVKKDLKGRPLEDLQWQLGEHITLDPFFHQEDLEEFPQPLSGGRFSNNWEISEDVEVKQLGLANRQALNALAGGAEAIRFILRRNYSQKGLKTLLNGIKFDDATIHFYQKNDETRPDELLQTFRELVRKRGIVSSTLKGSLNWRKVDRLNDSQLADLVQFTNENFPKFKVLSVGGDSFFRGSGGGVVKELADTIAAATAYFVRLKESRLPPEIVNQHLQFSMALGTSYFVEIAKIRALKLLWANVLKAYGVERGILPPIEAHFAIPVQKKDPHANMIQATSQAMAAVIGGVNRLTVYPSDAIREEPSTSFSRRIARNVQHILKMESYFERVADPAAGSYFIEKLTEKLAKAAWKEFQKLVIR